MRENTQPPPNPADVARETFSRLARQRIAPTPDNYRDTYNEIIGLVSESNAEAVLENFARQVGELSAEVATFAPHLKRALLARDWSSYSAGLIALTNQYLHSPQVPEPAVVLVPEPVARQFREPAPADINIQIKMLREMLTRTIGYALPPLLLNAPDLVTEATAVAADTKKARTEEDLENVATRLKKLCFKLDIKGVDLEEQQDLMLQLFRLLLENLSELLEDDSWLQGQISAVHKLMSGPITHLALKDATASLKEIIYKQGLLKHSLSAAKVTVKGMMMTFIDRLGAAAVSSGDYHQKIDQYSQKISVAQDVAQLNQILEDLMHETRAAQIETLRSRDAMVSARQEMQEAEARIHALESELDKMSELAREDQLTGSLNRRGLDDVFAREFSRVDHKGTSLCVAMLDLDDFKRLNDTHGHLAGDEALVHLVALIKETLRTMDVVGRFGGEEFLIILPDSTLAAATQTVTRVQRELTKRIFMINNEQLLITFSAGVAARHQGEEPAALIKRADGALYEAKKTGKNRIALAD